MKNKYIKQSLLSSLAVVSTVTPLISTVSCGKVANETHRVGDKYDKEYGVDEAVYTKLKLSFVEQATAGLPIEQAAKMKKQLNSSFKVFDTQLDEQHLGYTVISNGLIEYAARLYPNVKLVRETTKKTVKWDDLTVEFEGMKNSMKAYMDNLGIHGDDQTPFLEEANRVFNGTNDTARYPGIVKTVQAKYHDPLMGLMQAKAQMLQCFESVDEKIGLVGASIRLNQFFENHEIFYDVTTSDNAPNKFDNMKNTWLNESAKGQSIEKHITDIFNIKDKRTGKVLKEFKPESICPGYIVKPILKGWTEDPITNEYVLNIDWTCVHEAHVNTEREDFATAHFFNNTSEDMSHLDVSDEDSLNDAINFLHNSAGVNYNVILSKSGEIAALKNTYFNNEEEHIVFGWKNTPEINAMDAFYFGDRIDDRLNPDNRKYNINVKSVAQTGITIGSEDENKNAIEAVRLDTLLETSELSETHSQNSKSRLVNDFIQNCLLHANTNIVKDSETLDISLLSRYKNSSYDFENGEEEVVAHTLNKSLFQISELSYEFLTQEYNLYSQMIEPYTKNTFNDEYEEAETQIILESLGFSLNALLALETTVFCFVPVFAGKLPIYILILALTWISMAGQIASLTILVVKKWNPVKNYKNSGDKLVHDKNVVTFSNLIKSTGDSNSLCRANEDKIITKTDYDAGYKAFVGEGRSLKDQFFDRVLPAIELFQNMRSTDECEAFVDVVNKSDCSPEKYESEMSVWDDHGWCLITTFTLAGITLALDITTMVLLWKCPELLDWQLMKEARLAAEESGSTTKEILTTYKNLEKIKKFRKTLSDFTPTKLTPEAAEQFGKDISGKWYKAFDKKHQKIAYYENTTQKMEKEFPELYNYYRSFPSGEVIQQGMNEGKTLDEIFNREQLAEQFLTKVSDLCDEGVGGFENVLRRAFSSSRATPDAAWDESAFYFAKQWMNQVKKVDQAKEFEVLSGNVYCGSAFRNYKQLFNTSAQNEISRAIDQASKFLNADNVEDFLSAFKKIDNIMFKNPTKYLKKEFADIKNLGSYVWRTGNEAMRSPFVLMQQAFKAWQKYGTVEKAFKII